MAARTFRSVDPAQPPHPGSRHQAAASRGAWCSSAAMAGKAASVARRPASTG